jgi:hypothetical protein
MAKQCKAIKRDGDRCPNPASASGYCFTHDPAKAAQRSAARKLGGFNRKTAARVSGDEPIKIESLADVLKLINAIIADTWQQDNGAARSRALLAAAESARGVLEVTDLEKRLAQLEAQQAEGTK